MPSFHQDGLFEALLASGEVDLRVVFARDTTPDRLRLGWKKEARNYRHRFLSSPLPFLDGLRSAWSERSRLHIVSGIWAEPSFAIALCTLALAGRTFVVYAEAPDPRLSEIGIGSIVRRSFGSWVAKRAAGILAVSRFAASFYSQLGFDADRLYPFGYFQSAVNKPVKPQQSRNGERTEVIFVGQLIRRKGVDLLLEAMVPLFDQHEDLFLTVVGGGIEARSLESCARALGIQDRVSFEGPIDSDSVQSSLASADVLVLPSRWDGWGMVVNEALSAGVPVIVSDRCGAADLIEHGVSGYVFRSEDVDDLRDCLRKFLDNVDDRLVMRSAAAATGRAVSAEIVAPYLIECLKHLTGASGRRPAPPWARVPASQSACH